MTNTVILLKTSVQKVSYLRVFLISSLVPAFEAMARLALSEDKSQASEDPILKTKSSVNMGS